MGTVRSVSEHGDENINREQAMKDKECAVDQLHDRANVAVDTPDAMDVGDEDDDGVEGGEHVAPVKSGQGISLNYFTIAINELILALSVD